MRVVFFLVRQRDDLGALALSVSDPGSKDYGRYRSVHSIAARYGASPAVIAQVDSFLSSFGATAEVDVTGTFASALLDPDQVLAIFGPDPHVFPPVPAQIVGAVTGIVGTFRAADALAFGRVEPQRATDTIQSGEAWPPWSMGSGSPAPCPDTADPNACDNIFPNPGPPRAFRSFTPDQLRTAYGIEATRLTGLGRTAVVIEFGQAVLASDVKTYTAGLGLPPLPLHQILVDDRGVPLAAGFEATLDVETIAGIARGVSRVTLLAAYSGAAGEYVTYWPILYSQALDARVTGGRLTDVISSSWSLACERDIPSLPLVDATEAIFQTAAAAGVTVVTSAGDQGSTACVPRQPPYDNGFLSVQYPSASPWVTGVGGTNLELEPDNTIHDAQVWNDWPLELDRALPGVKCETPPCRPVPVWAGAGGHSTLFDRPPWQVGAGVDPAGNRQVPDLAFLGDIYPGTLLHVQGEWGGRGNGTSQAAPIFAAITMLLNEFEAKVGRPRIGFANPLLYQLAARTPQVFFDVVEGDNIIGDNERRFEVDCCFAHEGYDEASGWGSLLVDRAIATLAPRIVPIVPGTRLPRVSAPRLSPVSD